MSTAATSALSALLSSLNNGSSGLNVAAAVASVIAADAAPETVWENDQSTLSRQSGEIQQLESEANNLSSSLQALNDPVGALYSTTATSSAPSVVAASAASGAASGQHSIVVTQLASKASWYSAEVSSPTATLASGSFTLQTAGGTQSFTTGSGGSTDLSDLATAINGAGLGVTASVVSDANGSRLSIISGTSGQPGAFSVTNASGLSFTQAEPGDNAELTVDGVPVSSTTNTVADAVPGVTLNVAATGSAIVYLTSDTSTIDSAISSFVNNYNSLISDLNNQFTFNTSTNAEGVLSSDSVARSMQNDILSAANLSIGSGTYKSLASLGISTTNTGTLTLDTDTLNSALSSDFSGVVSFFQGSGSGSSAVTGFANSVISTLNNYIDPVQGAFTVDLSSLSSENSDLQDQINSFDVYLTSEQSTLTEEYNNANIALQQLPETIKQTQALLNPNSSGNNN